MKQDGSMIVIEDAKIVLRNFAGKEGMYNREGDRNFKVLLDEETARTLSNDGWLVKQFKQREEGEPPQSFIQVSVGFNYSPPRIVMLTSRGHTNLSENEVEVLDWVDIKTIDLIIRPYNWSVSGNSGIKAYLKSLFVTIEEDYLELKYADELSLPARGGRVEGDD